MSEQPEKDEQLERAKEAHRSEVGATEPAPEPKPPTPTPNPDEDKQTGIAPE